MNPASIETSMTERSMTESSIERSMTKPSMTERSMTRPSEPSTRPPIVSSFVHAFGMAALAIALAGCGAKRPEPEPPIPASYAIVKIKSNVRDALLYVDGRFEATLDRMRGGIAVSPGAHRFELRHDDYFSSYLEITVQRAERKQVSMEMAPVLP